MEWLFDIIKNGTLVDNQFYSVNQGVLTNKRLSEPLSLNSRAKGQWEYPYNKESAIWHFLTTVSHDVEKTLGENKTDALILFNDEDYEHNSEGGFISVTGTDARNFALETGNLIGFVKRGDYSLKISSRFGDSFLKYIISDADGFIELDNIGGESHKGGYEWLLAYLWNIKFKRAYRLGLPKSYKTKKERIPCVRGSIDVIDYFQRANTGKYLCSYREHSYNNLATSLFISAYESIEDYSFCQRTRSIYNSFLSANQGDKKSCQELLTAPYFTNPYYNDYNVLIDLSKQIINRKGSDFDSSYDSSAFFFDISMLFEYFIRKLIQRHGIKIRSKYKQCYEIPTGALVNNRRELQPDIVVECENGVFIFDVKYKSFDSRFGVKREDLFQIHTYIGQFGNDNVVMGGGFIYPISDKRWEQLNLEQSKGVISDVIYQQGRNIPFYVMFIKIPDSNCGEFNQLMLESCKQFCDVFDKQIFS